MLRSFKLKIFANKGKKEKINKLLNFWKIEINKKIDIFWKFEEIKGPFCPTEYALGGRLIRDASTKAWQIVKGAKRGKAEKPIFEGNEIDFNQASISFIDHKSKEFDFWVKITHLEKNKRLALPCKKIGIFNKTLEVGTLKKSGKIIRKKDNFYLQIYIEIPEKEKTATNLIGIDVGLNNSVATSDAKFYGQDIRALRIRTKHRKYNGLSASKQSLNRVAKELIDTYPDTNFAVEKLLFKGKKKRSKEFRRRNNNWAYKWLSKRLVDHSNREGFFVYYVESAYSSQTCPLCNSINRANRAGDSFCCDQCGYTNHADTVGAINIAALGRVAWERSVPMSRLEGRNLQRN
jgi:IS605 OrfB family transposase